MSKDDENRRKTWVPDGYSQGAPNLIGGLVPVASVKRHLVPEHPEYQENDSLRDRRVFGHFGGNNFHTRKSRHLIGTL